ncbi:MAG TPA: hypothetical protein PKY05_13700 [Fibrobacteria bacterium]|nr:hypothetical protein [Fibrobacteria bacterium]
MPRTEIDLSLWQDFRGKDEGVLIHINTSRESVMPVRDALDEFKKGQQTEPNYETGTFGLVGPSQVQLRNSLVKNKKRYILFGTFYEGLSEAYKGKFLLVGYMRIDKIRDVKKLHLRKWALRAGTADELLSRYFEMDNCWALYSTEMRFFSPEDSIEVTPELAKKWGAKGKLNKQARLNLTAEQTHAVLEQLRVKPDMTEEYIATVKEFQEFLKEEEGEEE